LPTVEPSPRRKQKRSSFRFSLQLDKLVVDWRRHEISSPHDRWYVYDLGWI
jgi:hypothetical protein